MAKDRAAPFSRKHRRYWLPVTGGMLLIGAVNLFIGYMMWPGERKVPLEKINVVIPPAAQGAEHDAGMPRDAGVSRDAI